jgi:hypothetical protein
MAFDGTVIVWLKPGTGVKLAADTLTLAVPRRVVTF